MKKIVPLSCIFMLVVVLIELNITSKVEDITTIETTPETIVSISEPVSETFTEPVSETFTAIESEVVEPELEVITIPTMAEIVTEVETATIKVDLTCISEPDIEALAKMAAGEGGYLPDEEIRYIYWTVFHRVNEGRWVGGNSNTIVNVINHPGQFVGKNGGNNWASGSEDFKEHLRQLAREEYQKWVSGEMCPENAYAVTESARYGYNSFTGDGSHNWFTKK